LEVIESAAEPDLVVLDVAMPGMDGYTLCRAIRKNAAMARTPVVMLSARDDGADQARGRLAGVDAYVSKPFEPAALVRVVRKFCGIDSIGTLVEAE